jgi:hypothetical protein
MFYRKERAEISWLYSTLMARALYSTMMWDRIHLARSGFLKKEISGFDDSRIRIRIKEFKYFNPPKILFLSSRKYDPKSLSRIRIPHLDFLPIPARIQWSNKHRIPDPDPQYCNNLEQKLQLPSSCHCRVTVMILTFVVCFRGAQAAIVVYDITNADTFERAKSWVKELQRQVQ